MTEKRPGTDTMLPPAAPDTEKEDPTASHSAVREEKEEEEEEEEGNDDDFEYPTKMKLVAITVALCLSVFCMALVGTHYMYLGENKRPDSQLTALQDNTIIATAIPRITDQFKALNDVGWYGSAYLLTTCSTQLIYGKFYSFYSIKWVYLVALAIFELGSLLCGLAPNSTALIVGRAIAGVGAAGIFSGAILIISVTVPLRQRPTYMVGSQAPMLIQPPHSYCNRVSSVVCTVLRPLRAVSVDPRYTSS